MAGAVRTRRVLSHIGRDPRHCGRAISIRAGSRRDIVAAAADGHARVTVSEIGLTHPQGFWADMTKGTARWFVASMAAASLAVNIAAGQANATPRVAAPVLLVEAPPAAAAAAQRVRSFDTRRLEAVMRIIGLTHAGAPIPVVLAPQGSRLASNTPTWIAGFADGESGTVVLFPDRAPGYPDDTLEELLHHEVAHILIARAAGQRPVPRWFNEGLAMTAEHAWRLEDRTRVAYELLGGGGTTLEELERLFDKGRPEVARAYALSGAFVRSVLTEHGPESAAAILRHVARGQSFGDAFEAATGRPLVEVEQAFWRRQVLWNRWVPFLTSSVALWMGVTLLALYAIRRQREKRKRWDDEDGSETASDSEAMKESSEE